MIEFRKGEDPTTEGEKEEEKVTITHEKLYKKFTDLQEEWESMKKNAKSKGRPRYSTDKKLTMLETLHLLENSPRDLVSSLQGSNSSPEGWWKVRASDLAVEEVRQDRRAAIESGRIKGRRLFEAVENKGDQEKNEDSWGMMKEGFPVHSWHCCSSSSSSGEVEERNNIVKGKNRCQFLQFWVAIALVLVAFGIVTLRIFDGDQHGDEVTLVPT